MKNHSVVKRQKQNEARHLRNKSVKTSVRTCAKKYTALVKAGDAAKAEAGLRELASKLDSAARKKSRMHKFYNVSFNKKTE